MADEEVNPTLPFPEIEWYRELVASEVPAKLEKYSDIAWIDPEKNSEENLERFLGEIDQIDENDRFEIFLLYFVKIFDEHTFTENIEKYYNLVKPYFSQITTLNSFRNIYSDAQELYARYLRDDRNRLEILEDDLDDFESPAFDVKQTKVDSVSFEVEIQPPPEVKNIISFFDAFQCDAVFPVLWIPPDRSSNTRGHLKVYTNASPDLKFTDRSLASNVLYLLIKFSERKNIVAEIFTEMKEDDQTAFKMQIVLDDGSKFKELKDLLAKFPFPIHNLFDSKAFFTYSISYNHVISILDLENFVTAVTVNGTLARYLSIRETSNPPTTTSIRMRYDFPFYYPDGQAIDFLIQGNQIFKKQGSDLISRTSSVSSVMSEMNPSEEDNAVIDIRMQGENEEAVAHFIPTIALLIQFYLTKLQDDFGQLLRNYCDITIPRRLVRTDVSRRSKSLASSRASSRLSSIASSRRAQTTSVIDMRQYFENMNSKVFAEKINTAIFGPKKVQFSLTSVCPADTQPLILKPNKVEEWNKQTFLWNNKLYNRIALPFPSIENPQFHLGCPSATHPFIGLIRSGTDKRLIPCCYNEDQNVPDKTLYKYLHGYNLDLVVPVAVKGNVIDNISVQEAGKVSVLPVVLDEFFRTITPDKDKGAIKYNKIGVPINAKSILHCCFLATWIEYKNIFNSNINVLEKEKRLTDFIIDKFTLFFETVDPDLHSLNTIADTVRDITLADLRDLLIKPDAYVDPKIFLRFLEEFFVCRLILFTANKNEIDYVEPNYFVAPSGFPVRNNIPGIKRRETDEKMSYDTIICLGQEHKSLFQWELVFWTTNTREKNNFTFDTYRSKEIASFLISNIRLNQISFTDTMTLYDKVGINIESIVEGLKKSDPPYYVVQQFIDSVGKCRAIKFQSEDNHVFVIRVPPSRPFSVESTPQIEVNADLEGYNHLIRMIKPTSVYVDNGLIWKFSWNDGTENNYIEYHVYPDEELTRSADIADIKNIIEKPYETYEMEQTQRYIELHKTARRFEKIIIYLYIKYLNENGVETLILLDDVNTTVDQFIQNHWEINPEVVYNFQHLRGSFPDELLFDSNLEHLEATGLTNGDKIYIESERLQEKMRLILIRWAENRLNANFTDYLFEDIPGFYEYSTDFEKMPGCRVYLGGKDFSSPVIIYLNELRNLQPAKVIRGPYNYISLVYPCSSTAEAINRAQLWKMDKTNINLTNDKRLLGKPKLQEMKRDAIETSLNLREETESIYILKEGEDTKRKSTKISVLLPLAKE